MPTPSSSFDSVTPLPPRVISIRHAIFDAPDEDGLSISVPTDYSFYISEDTPDNDLGRNGDWYMKPVGSSLKTYRKIIGTWNIVSDLTGSTGGGGGGGGGDGLTFTNSIWTGGTITNATIAGGTMSGTTIIAPTLTSPIITGGTISSPVITAPVITGGSIIGAYITGLGSPAGPTDAVTKQYVDGVAQGLQVHDPVEAASTGNITPAGGAPTTVDGYTVTGGKRILLKDQTDPKQNGIYVVTIVGSGSNGTWTRTADADSGHELDRAYVLVINGTTNGGTSWVVSGTPTIGLDDINWTRFFAVTSVPASIITGGLDSSQITSVSASSIIGSITATQIGSVNASTIIGSITSSQIGSVSASTIVGSITSGQIGSVSATSIVGSISSTQIGSVSATAIVGSITSSQITSVSATAITGSITAGQIGSLNASTITGVIVTNQLADQILNTQRLIANDISVVRRVTALPTLPDANYPSGALALNTTNKTLYQVVSGAWQVVTASSNVVGTLTSNDIASVNAASITGLIIASQIGSVNATAITGTISSSQIGSISASSITGTLSSSQIGSVSASSIIGTLTSSQISTVSASAIVGTISASQIGSVNASSITGSLNSSQISSVNATSITGSISSSQISSVNANTIIVGSLGANSISSGSGNQLSQFATGQISIGQPFGSHFQTVCTGTTSSITSEWRSGDGGTITAYAYSTSLPPVLEFKNGSGTATVTVDPGSAGISKGKIAFNDGTCNGRVTIDTNSRLSIQTTTSSSIAFNTAGSDRFFIGSDGHLKSNGGYFMKVSSDGWSPRLFTGSNVIEFMWSGGLYARIDGSATIGPFLT